MPIEIRELIIKTTVEKKTPRAAEASLPDKAELKQELLQACRKMVKQVLKENAQR